MLERKQNVLERKQKDELEWLEDEAGYYVCSWCPKKVETEEHVRSVEMALQFLYAIRGLQRTDKPIRHAICETHKTKLLDDYAKGIHGL